MAVTFYNISFSQSRNVQADICVTLLCILLSWTTACLIRKKPETYISIQPFPNARYVESDIGHANTKREALHRKVLTDTPLMEDRRPIKPIYASHILPALLLSITIY